MDLSEQHYLERDRSLTLRAFLVANYEHLRRGLAHQLGCADLAAECLHDAWLRLGDVAVCMGVQSPDAYVRRVARNAATDRLRTTRPWQYSGDADAELAAIADDAPGPDRVAEARSDLAAVERAMGCMPRRHQAVFTALRLDGLTRDEVATHYGLSLQRVDTVLRQALDHCAREIDRPVMAGVRAPRRALRRMPPND